jgi:hypothetical protein
LVLVAPLEISSEAATAELKAALPVPAFALAVVSKVCYAVSCASMLERHSSM